MKWEAAPLFATPVFKLHIPEPSKISDFFDLNVKNQQTEKDSQGALSHFHSQSNLFEIYQELAPLRETLERAGSFVYSDLLNFKKSGKLKTTNAWFNLCEVGGSQRPHNHVNCLLCGTLYLRADEHTELRFYHPQNNPSFHPELYDAPDTEPNSHGLRFHLREAKISVQPGDCLFWPSWLKHGYVNNQTPDRLTLSFNMMPEKLNVDYQPFI